MQQRDFAFLRGFEELLFNCRQRVNGIDLDGLRVVLHASANRRNGLRPGRGEQQRLPLGGRKANRFINRVAETHIEHSIRFVHHQRLQRVQ